LVISPENLVTHDKHFPSYIDQEIAWDDESTPIATGAIGKAIGTGNSHTNDIISVLGLGSYANIDRFYAAKLCYDLEVNGYSDWYLPSIHELAIIMINQFKLDLNSTYWSSTEISSGTALFLNMNNQGTTFEEHKGYQTWVRAVRSF
jgi:hypothetical protein